MFNFDSKRPIAIWGTGVQGGYIYYLLSKDGKEVDLFFDNRVDGEGEFLDKRVIKPTSEYVTAGNFYIFVSCKYATYISIAEQLQNWGMKEFCDFVYYESYNKKIAILHGNCHMNVLCQYLSRTEEFAEKYVLYPNPMIQSNKKGYIEQKVLDSLDLLILQDIREENTFGYKLSENYLRAHVNPETICITVPNLFDLGYGFFPLTVGNKNNAHLLNGKNKNGMFPRKVYVIDDLYESGYDENEIIEKIRGKDLLPQAEIREKFDLYLGKIKDREENWDVKVLNFIVENYHKERIFHDPGHPTNFVMKEICRQVLEKLNINTVLDINDAASMDGYEEPVLPCVKAALGLEYGGEEIIRKGLYSYKMSPVMDLEEYVREYIFWRYKSLKGKK